MSVEKQILKNLWENTKVASKDWVDMSIVLVAMIISILDLLDFDMTGGLAFLTFYIMFLLIRKAELISIIKSK